MPTKRKGRSQSLMTSTRGDKALAGATTILNRILKDEGVGEGDSGRGDFRLDDYPSSQLFRSSSSRNRWFIGPLPRPMG
jgi:hypothetical protein